uniref:Sigma non-opioid intracellular receptor 1 n=1 Tax=Phallusia mammillata TaxID=59560 RepID=A0A6F9DSC3_9ASCI|nr:sigma non-opioid intracellular receptor 1-like [Phallusia mammillata]
MGYLRILIYIIICFVLAHYYLGIPKFTYTFKVKAIKETAYKHSGGGYSSESIQRDFYRQYPAYILDGKHWIPAYTGGLHGAVAILYASFTELLVLYHAEVETTGSTGRHYMNVSVTVLTGSMSESAHNLAPQTTLKPGENKVFRMGESSTVKLSQKTALLVYCRGIVPLTMGYWLSDSIFSHHDPLLALSTILNYGKAVIVSNTSIWEWCKEMFTYMWKVSSDGLSYLFESAHYSVTHLPETINDIGKWVYTSTLHAWNHLMELLL